MTTVEFIQSFTYIIVGLLVYLYHLFFQHLPAKQQQLLELFAPKAVQMIEQVYASSSNPEKKALAMSTIKMLFRTAHQPVPSDDVINTSIEAAVYAVKQSLASSTVLRVAPDTSGNPTIIPLSKEGESK